MKRAFLVLVVLLISVALPIAFFATVPRRSLDHRVGKALTHMSTLELAIVMYLDEFGALPVASERRGASQEPGRLARILKGDNAEGKKFVERLARCSDNGGFADPWGRPYHVCFDTDADGRAEVGGNAVPKFIAIWSDGPNRVNEHGDGDDISNWRNVEDYMR